VAEFEWNIAKPGPQCCACQAGFAVEAPYYSALLQEATGLVRKDFCNNCFQTQRPADLYYFWKTQISAEDTEGRKAWKQKPVVDVEYVFDFFKRLDGDPNPQQIAFRFILALMLTRKKILVADGRTTLPDGASAQVFAEKRGGQKHTVVEPSLSEAEIDSVSAELGVLLGLKPPPAKAPAEPADAVAATGEGTPEAKGTAE
jgi:hypothetical protein